MQHEEWYYMTIMYLKKYHDSYDNRKVISLFSGAMGLDLGLEKAGLEISIGQDCDKDCANTIEANNHSVIRGDIRDIDADRILELSGLKRGEVFLVCGGPPCQPFSTAGKHLGINDPRGSLFMDFKRIIDHIRPRFFLMENVKGLLSSSIKHVPLSERNRINKLSDDEQPGSVFQVVKDQLESMGYKIIYGLLDAVNYGVPQFRERLVILGSRDNEDIFLPMPTHFQLHQENEYKWKTLKDAIEDLENNPGPYLKFSQARIELLDLVPEGGNWRDLPKELIKKAMGGAYLSSGGKVGFFRRLAYAEPSPTLVTSPIQKASMLCHPKQNRPLSIKEYARIQQFDDNWIFTGSINSIYKQIGNAVPIGLGRAIGKALLSTAEGNSIVKSKRIRGTDVHNKIQSALVANNYE
jgi:DNA (cytosine-5)-methyltransferase 1